MTANGFQAPAMCRGFLSLSVYRAHQSHAADDHLCGFMLSG